MAAWALLSLACSADAAWLDDVLVQLPDAPGRAVRVPVPAAAGADGRYEVDLLVLYTHGARQKAGADLVQDAAERVQYANRVFDNSLIPVRYRLVAALAYPGDTEPGLPELPQTPEVVALREAHGADLVAVLRAEQGTACGQAFPFNGGTYAAAEPDNVDPDRDAYSLIFCLDGNTFVHELGHNLGAGHDTAFSGKRDPVLQQPIPGVAALVGSGYWKTYAHAWRCGNSNLPGSPRCSVMHYCLVPDAFAWYAVTGDSPYGDFFSNPRLMIDGQSCGSEGPVEALQADNARSISEAAPYVAAYRAASAAKADYLALGALSWAATLLFAAAALVRRRSASARLRWERAPGRVALSATE